MFLKEKKMNHKHFFLFRVHQFRACIKIIQNEFFSSNQKDRITKLNNLLAMKIYSIGRKFTQPHG